MFNPVTQPYRLIAELQRSLMPSCVAVHHLQRGPCTDGCSGRSLLLQCAFWRLQWGVTAAAAVSIGAAAVTTGAAVIIIDAAVVTQGAAVVTLGAAVLTIRVAVATTGAAVGTTGCLHASHVCTCRALTCGLRRQ